MKTIVKWPEGRPLEWYVVAVPDAEPEPPWLAEAQRLRRCAYSYRRIAEAVGAPQRDVNRILQRNQDLPNSALYGEKGRK